MVAPSEIDSAGQSETHKDSTTKEPVKLGLHASVHPDTLPFVYAKDKHPLTFTVENTGESVEIFKIKTTASYLYRIRPVFFKLGVRERQEVTVTYKGTDAGPIPLSAKDRITVVFAHALDPRKTTSALWDLHKPFAHLSYAESREYVRVLFVDETGRLAVSAAREKSRGGLEKPKAKDQKSLTARPQTPRRASTPPREADEKSNNTDNEADVPSNAPQQQPLRAVTPRTPRTPAARAPAKQVAGRTPSPHSKDSRKSPATSSGGRSTRDPIESLLSSVAKDASAIVCVQYPTKGFDEGATVDDETSRRDEDSKKVRDVDTEGRRDEVLRKKMEEMRRLEDEDKSRRKKEDRKKKEDEREDKKRKEEEREEKKRKDEEREDRKKKEEEREDRKRKEEERVERKRKDEEREERKKREEERRVAEEEDRRKKEDEDEEKAAALKPQRRTSNEDIKQEAAAESPRPEKPRRKVLGPDGQYHDDDSNYLDESIRRKNGSVRLLKKGGTRTGSRDNSVEDDKPRRASLEDDN